MVLPRRVRGMRLLRMKEVVAARRVRHLARTARSRHPLLVANRTAASGSRSRRRRIAASLLAAVTAPALHLRAAARAGATGIGPGVPVRRADLARPVTGAAAVHARNST